MGVLERKAGGPDNWLEKVGGLDPYLEEVANAIHTKRGKTISNAIQIAWGMIRKWATGGGDVNPDTRAKAAAAVQNMEAKRARNRGLALAADPRIDLAEYVDLASPTDEAIDTFVLDLAAAAQAEHDEQLEQLDLAPGDYRPPYDWKHGYIPITPAAALSKAKKAPYAGKGRAKPPKGTKIVKATKGARRLEAKTDAAKRLAKARDDEQRGRAVPGEAQAAQNAVNASGPRRSDGDLERRIQSLSATGRNPDEKRALIAERDKRKAAGEWNPAGVAPSAGDVKDRLRKGDSDEDAQRPLDPRLALSAARASDALHRDGRPTRAEREETKLKVQRVLDKARADGKPYIIVERGGKPVGINTETGVLTPYGTTSAIAAADKLKAGGVVDLNGPTVKGGSPWKSGSAADAERKAQESAAGKPRKNLPGGGSYPTKADGSPDYGAMSAEQAATIRAKMAGRGVGQRVDTDQGPGTVTAVSSRSTTVDLDAPDAGKINIVAGTPGHDRIKPAKSHATKVDESLTSAANARQASAKRAELQNAARAAGYDGNLIGDSSDQLEAFLDAKKKGRPIPVGRAVNARQPGIEKVTTGRLIGYDNQGMMLVKPHSPKDAPAGRFNPSHVAEAGKPLRNTPDSREGRDTDRRPRDPLGRVDSTLPNRSDETATDRRAQERAIERKDYGNAEGPVLAAEAARRGLIGEQRATQKSDAELRKLLKDADDRTAASQARGPDRADPTKGTGRFMSPETAGGITEANAKAMTDEQLERAMQRLMAAGTYDGPAFGIIERELNRRDAARAEGNRRGR